MSADLLAAFGDPSELKQDRHKDNVEASQSQSLFKPALNGNDVLFDADDGPSSDDDFGEFEDAKPEPSQGESEKPQLSHTRFEDNKAQQNAGHDAPLIDLLTLDEEAQPSSGPAPGLMLTSGSNTTATVQDFKLPTTRGDANEGALDILADDDGWGDFADVEQPRRQSEDLKGHPLPTKSTALHDLSTTPSILSQQPLQDTNSRQPARDVRAAKPRSKPQPEPEPEPEPEVEEAWSDFDDMPSVSTHSQPKASTSPDQARPPSAKPPPTRPTNVPPPSLLLSFLPTACLDLVRSGNTPSPSQILGTFHVASRIIAGRSLRWKRDALLSQSTRIAAAGRPGGMKLASVNKSENLAEEREAAEVVEVWNKNLVKLQAALGKEKLTTTGRIGGASRSGLRLGPAVGVKTATGPAILDAKVICALCGLKRNERAVGIDDNVEDVFGEFWVETWGHRECCEWWEQWKQQLRQRS